MGVVIGIDVGGSTTKIIGVENKSIQSPMFVKATDPVTSLFGAFGKYIYDNGILAGDRDGDADGCGKRFHRPTAIRLADSQDR